MLHGKRLGVIGLGRIGAKVAGFGKAFGMEVGAWSQNLTPERCREVGVEHLELGELLRRSDVISIHLVLSERTEGLIGRQELSLMKPSALLVNISRGPIVDEAALIEALEAGTIGGAGLDVFDQEPLPPDHPLRRAERCVLTPHIGYVADGSYEGFYAQSAENVRAYLDGGLIPVLNPDILDKD
ncbi:MAG: NAD(P)-dependent oxidoreductase, partial [Rhodospirillales bacterium]|nr:NAD(P)-dependent oxidoreductase [Rhodospirillales bacterium]